MWPIPASLQGRMVAMLTDSAVWLQTWLIKLDESDNGLGIAHLSTHQVPSLAEALQATQAAAARFLQNCGIQSAPEIRRWPQVSSISYSEAQIAQLNEARLGCEHSLCQCLLRGLARALRMAAPEAFPSYRSFIEVCIDQIGCASACCHIPSCNWSCATMCQMRRSTCCAGTLVCMGEFAAFCRQCNSKALLWKRLRRKCWAARAWRSW